MKFFEKLFFFIIFFFVYTNVNGQCNVVQILTSPQISQLQSLQMPIDTALFYENLNQIDSLQSLSKIVYGNQGGIPDVIQPAVILTANTNWLSTSSALSLSRLLIDSDSMIYVDIWKVCKGMAPPAYLPHSMILRSGAEVCIGLIRIAAVETDPLRANAYRQWAKRGLDSLMTMQLSSGAFPFPDLRTYNDPVFTPIINNYLQSLGPDSVLVLQNGWIIDDSGTGEFKFDAGVIGGAFGESVAYTLDTNYRNASDRVANYLLPLHFNTNFNYNTFAAYGLIHAWNNTQSNSTWRDRAVTTLRYSVLPGQIPNGRWMDGHNAKSVYHSIIIHNTSALLLSMAATDILRDTLSQMLCVAVRNFISQNDTCGSTTGFDCLLRAHKLNASIVPQPLHDSISDLIGRYIQQVAISGNYIDVYTMGLYLELVGNPLAVSEQVVPGFQLQVYPNPATSNVTIEYETSSISSVKIEIIDITGRTISFIEHTDIDVGLNHLSYSLTGISNGVYFLRISNGIENKTTMFVIN